MGSTHDITLTVNGRPRRGTVPARTSLADFLRDELGLTGTHLGCEHGVCGACTVLLDGTPVRSCILLAAQAEDRSVTTVEGLADEHGHLNPLQRAFCRTHALQCGFCTPGMLLALQSMLDTVEDPTREDVDDAIGGNICRCTGYVQIREAAQIAVDEARCARSAPITGTAAPAGADQHGGTARTAEAGAR